MENVNSRQKFSTHRQSKTSPKRYKRRKNPWAVLAVSVGAVLIILPLVMASSTLILFQVRELNLPGVVVHEKNVGMTSRAVTAEWIDHFWNRERPIQLSTTGETARTFLLSPAQLGLWVDPDATAEAAYHIGRSSESLHEIRAAVSGEAQVVMPVLYFDEAAARQTLETIAQELEILPEDAVITFQDGQWLSLPGSEGLTLDTQTTLSSLYENAFSILLNQSMTLNVQPVAPEVSDLSPILDEISRVVSQPLTFEAYDPILDETWTWSVPEDEKQTWVEIDPQTHHVKLSYDSEKVMKKLESWAAELGEGRAIDTLPEPNEVIEKWENGETLLATIRHAPTTYQVESGESLWSISLKLGIPMWRIMDANEGLTAQNISSGMKLTIPSKNDLLPLPVVPNKRIVVDISEQTMTVFENGKVRNNYIISTGMSDSPTMPGIFQIQTHNINAYASNWDLYMPHFMGIYEAWPGFMNGIHGLPILSSGQRLWASALGRPASYGCIILDLAAAEDLYDWADPGVVVEITR